MKLSIITINYNNLEGLKKTVDSVLSQTWRDFEWIIVDGGSTDGSKEYIEKLAQSLSEGTAIDGVQWTVERFSLPGFTAEDLKVNASDSGLYQSSTDNRQSPIANRPQRLLWCSESDKGVYNAMNKGIAKARGEYLNFMNSGDCFYENDTLEKVCLSSHLEDFIYGNRIRIVDGIEELDIFPDYLSLVYLLQNGICHQAQFIKKSVFKESLYREDLKIVSDWEKLIVSYLKGRTYVHIQTSVVKYDITGISSVNRDLLKIEKKYVVENLQKEYCAAFTSELFRLMKEIEEFNNDECRAALRLVKRGHMRKQLLVFLLQTIDWIDKFFHCYY